jgi:hypothetical protein
MDFLFALSAYRLDALILAGAAFGAMAFVQRRARRLHSARGVSWLAWLLLALCVLGGAGLAEYAGGKVRDQLRSMLRGFATTYAIELQRFGHADLRNDAPPDDPLYLSLIAAQKRWLAVNRSIYDIYTFRKLPNGAVIFLVDSETDYDRNGRFEGEREARTPIG